MHILSYIPKHIYFTMQTKTLLQLWMLKNKLKEFMKIPAYPPLHSNEEGFEGFRLGKEEVQALNICLENSYLSLSFSLSLQQC